LGHIIGQALERTASLWPGIEQSYRFVHALAHRLGNPHEESAVIVQRRVNGLLGAMQRHRGKVGALAFALDHFQKVTRSYRPGLFHTYAVPDLPRTNNDLEHLFGSQRYHERRATGRKTASPGAVLRGSVRLIAATATRVFAPSARELGAVDKEHWRRLRQRLDHGRQARTLRTRFRHDPAAYLAALEQQACQLALPS
jgi:hypothetical protein